MPAMLLAFKLGYTEIILFCFHFIVTAGLLTHLPLEEHPVNYPDRQ